MMKVRADLGMVFQEGALFDSLTVAENTGYKLSEETALDGRQGARAGRRDARLRRPARVRVTGCRRSCRADSGGASRSRGRMAARPGILLYDEATTGLDPITATTVDEEMVKLRDLEEVSSIIVTHQLRDAFFTATHEAVRRDGRIEIVEADAAKRDEAEFIMLRDGLICFEGNAAELRAVDGSVHPELSSPRRTSSHAAHAFSCLGRTEGRPHHHLRDVDDRRPHLPAERPGRISLAAVRAEDRLR